MPPISQVTHLLTASYKMFFVFDGESFADDVGAPKGSGVVSQGSNHIYIKCVDDIVRPSVTVRFWSSSTGETGSGPGQGWQVMGHGALRLDSGTLSLAEIEGGAFEIDSPFTEDVHVRVSSQGREEARAEIREVEQSSDPLGLSARESVTQLQLLDGRERYLLDVFRREASATRRAGSG